MAWTGEQIRRHRTLRGWSQDDAATALGVSRRSISSWESGEARPQGRHADALDRVFGTTTSEPTLSEATGIQLVAQIAVRLAAQPDHDGDMRLLAWLSERLAPAEPEGGLPERDLAWPRRTAPNHGHNDLPRSGGA